MSSDAAEPHRLPLGALANLWAEDRNTPSQIALTGRHAHRHRERTAVSDVAVLAEGIEHALGAGERAVPGARPSSRRSPM